MSRLRSLDSLIPIVAGKHVVATSSTVSDPAMVQTHEQVRAEPVESTKQPSVEFQSPGGPVITIKYLQVQLSLDSQRLVLVSEKSSGVGMRLPADNKSGASLAAKMSNGMAVLLSLEDSFEFEFGPYRFLTLRIEDHAEPEPEITADDVVEDVVEYIPEFELKTLNDPRGALA